MKEQPGISEEELRIFEAVVPGIGDNNTFIGINTVVIASPDSTDPSIYGFSDGRSFLSAVELGTRDRLAKDTESINPPTLERNILSGLGQESLVNLPYAIAAPIQVIDALGSGLSINQKRMLLAYYLWEPNAAFDQVTFYMRETQYSAERELLEPLRHNDELIELYDQVREESDIRVLIPKIQFNRSSVEEMDLVLRLLRKRRVSNGMIAGLLNKTKHDISLRFSVMILNGDIEPTRGSEMQAKGFRIFCSQISELIGAGVGDYDEIASRLKSNRKSVQRAVRTLIAAGRKDLVEVKNWNYDKQTIKDVEGLARVEELRNTTDLTNSQIGEELGESHTWVDDRASILLKRKRVKRKKNVYDRKKSKQAMRAFLQQKISEDQNASTTVGEMRQFIPGDYSTVLSIYGELKEEMTVPQIIIRGKYNNEEIISILLSLQSSLAPGERLNLADLHRQGYFPCSLERVYEIKKKLDLSNSHVAVGS